MNAFSDIDSLLRVISRKKDILRFLFVSRKAPSLRPEQALENFLEEDSPRLEYLLDHGVVREAEGVLVLEDTSLRFFEEVLEVNEEINVLSVKQHIDALSENIELWLTKWQEAIDFLETNHPPQVYRGGAQHALLVEAKQEAHECRGVEARAGGDVQAVVGVGGTV